MKVFLYDNRIELGDGLLARVDGYKLIYMPHSFDASPEAIRSNSKSIYGHVYEVEDDTLQWLDAFYGVGIQMHQRINVDAYLEGGMKYEVAMYECTHETSRA